MKNNKISKIFFFFKKYKGIIISTLVASSFIVISYNHPFDLKTIYANSITCLSILFGFNMIVVTQYYSNVNFNLFLKKVGQFNGFKEKYRIMVIYLIISLIIIYTLSIFEELDFLFFNFICKSIVSNSIIVFLSLFNLFKSLEIIQEFFNVYGTTYSNSFRNVDLNDTDKNDQ